MWPCSLLGAGPLRDFYTHTHTRAVVGVGVSEQENKRERESGASSWGSTVGSNLSGVCVAFPHGGV